jgi:hypothetical protein
MSRRHGLLLANYKPKTGPLEPKDTAYLSRKRGPLRPKDKASWAEDKRFERVGTLLNYYLLYSNISILIEIGIES